MTPRRDRGDIQQGDPVPGPPLDGPEELGTPRGKHKESQLNQKVQGEEFCGGKVQTFTTPTSGVGDSLRSTCALGTAPLRRGRFRLTCPVRLQWPTTVGEEGVNVPHRHTLNSTGWYIPLQPPPAFSGVSSSVHDVSVRVSPDPTH